MTLRRVTTLVSCKSLPTPALFFLSRTGRGRARAKPHRGLRPVVQTALTLFTAPPVLWPVQPLRPRVTGAIWHVKSMVAGWFTLIAMFWTGMLLRFPE